ncbi:heterokaryon incompatibility protein-domain-containing protein [Immersiella caudata]|uniref:Heterokaryon incompatibility protein-domain-containing protein n=1 Tax=Immersiella caudata TaxID=314043 RepID=A0AA39U0W7_9PEZI|nr:heterokaryon incompatibility protein-domain-containing protein [Immersiella caudata]
MVADSRLTYTPLPDGWILLLRLLPSSNTNSAIQYELIDYALPPSLKQTQLFEALSYVWRSPDNPRKVSINGQELVVTPNLQAALTGLRDLVLDRVLWVDAICINQEDVAERGRQVRIMAFIYSCANRVTVWLGEESQDSTSAIVIIHGPPSKPGLRTQESFVALQKRPWFRRVWLSQPLVLQEATAASHISIICGGLKIVATRSLPA